ncbi:hypothetical protein COO60DRAFT_1089463 [Scenedesmus sp. NREL 46B-D3]|nr:hypothetical protein COO60DRAFT_1089463 [Scenedesmus sp. NREL 46B-D3]
MPMLASNTKLQRWVGRKTASITRKWPEVLVKPNTTSASHARKHNAFVLGQRNRCACPTRLAPAAGCLACMHQHRLQPAVQRCCSHLNTWQRAKPPCRCSNGTHHDDQQMAILQPQVGTPSASTSSRRRLMTACSATRPSYIALRYMRHPTMEREPQSADNERLLGDHRIIKGCREDTLHSATQQMQHSHCFYGPPRHHHENNIALVPRSQATASGPSLYKVEVSCHRTHACLRTTGRCSKLSPGLACCSFMPFIAQPLAEQAQTR